MTRRPRRNHTPAFKAKVALAAVKGDRTLAQLAEQSRMRLTAAGVCRKISIEAKGRRFPMSRSASCRTSSKWGSRIVHFG